MNDHACMLICDAHTRTGYPIHVWANIRIWSRTSTNGKAVKVLYPVFVHLFQVTLLMPSGADTQSYVCMYTQTRMHARAHTHTHTHAHARAHTHIPMRKPKQLGAEAISPGLNNKKITV